MKESQFGLTERQMEVLQLIALGYNNVQIAKKLFITIHTSKAHVAAILYKMNESNRLCAAIKAIKYGLVTI